MIAKLGRISTEEKLARKVKNWWSTESYGSAKIVELLSSEEKRAHQVPE